MRRTLLVLGPLLIVAAAVLKFAIVPGQAQWPADVDNTTTYDGQLATMLNAEAVAAADLAKAVVSDVPVTITNHTFNEAIVDDRAVVTSDSTVTTPDGTVIKTGTSTVGIDRVTVASTPVEGYDLPAREGLVTGFPIGTEARDYTGWSDEIGTTVTLAYDRTEQFEGIETYVFTSEISGERIVSESVLASVIPAVPKPFIGLVGETLGVSDDLLATLATASDALPDTVPLGYLYDGATTYNVDPVTGMVVDLQRTEVRSVFIDVAGFPAVPLAPVWDWTYQQSDASVAAAVQDAKDNGAKLTLFGSTLPLVLIGLGLLALIAGAVLSSKSGRASDDADLTANDATPTASPKVPVSS